MEKETLENFIAQRKSIRTIAAETGKGYATIRYWLEKHGLKTKCRPSPSKLCLTCKEEKPLYSNKYCKNCDRLRIVALGLKNRTRAISHKGGQCCNCGYNKCNSALDFHHRDPSTKDSFFATMKYWSWSRIEKELEKCVLVCSNCHREIHAGVLVLP